MNVEDTHKTAAPLPDGIPPWLVIPDGTRSSDDALGEYERNATMPFPASPEPRWPRVFPGL